MSDLADYRNFCKCSDDHEYSPRCSGSAVCAAHEEAIDDEIKKLREQLPKGMEHCTIQFKECEKGHGRLTATNWVQHECMKCEIDRLRACVRTLGENEDICTYGMLNEVCKDCRCRYGAARADQQSTPTKSES